MNPKVDFYFSKPGKWQQEIALLRNIALDCGLSEELKWGCPCYVFGKANIVLIHVFKEYCALLFFKGALLKDNSGLLVQQSENVQAQRQARFTDAAGITKHQKKLTALIYQAIEVEKAGLKVMLKKTSAYEIPEEFKQRLAANPDLKTAFEALTPGRQRAYLLYFTAPKQSKTRESRIDNYTPQILNGKGLND